ncbi:hypothetical protein [Rariglobus hedericola]|uniref:DUF3566 domain-containing protein n=1 Tax=Rariglobus hedericola TaxID=2597822 RepID=A0A556QRI9_9BACT|nr:hypothetical protein [Rariglobus hedericola]TSJ79256.1 hypothetical protein FPL22_08175 [Rariglobus hedericola]
MTIRIKKISPVQLGKMLAVIYGLASLIFVPFFLIMGLLASFAPGPVEGSALPAAIGLGLGIAFTLLFPVMYAFMGFITGLIGALIYNLVAGWIGGIEVEVE